MEHPSDKPLLPPYLALLIGVIAVSTSAIFVKLADAPAPIIATYRLVFSVVLTLPLLFWNRGAFREVAAMNRRVWLLCTLSGAFLASHFLLWFESLRFTSVASSTVLVTLQPLFAFIGGYLFFKEKIGPVPLLGGFLAIAGSFVIAWGDFQIGGMALWGDILALLGAMTVTGYWFVGQYLRQYLSSFTYTLVVYSVTSLLLVAYDLALGYPLVGYSAQDWGWFFCLALFPTLLGHSLLNWVIKWLNTTTISMGILGEPVGTAILAYFILGEVVTWPQVIGGTVILVGIALFIRFHQPAGKGVSSHEPSSPAAKKPS